MGLYCGFDVIEEFGFIEATPVLEIIPDYSMGCVTFINTFMTASTDYVPVDTGYLQSTISANCSDTYCECWTDCEYAQYVEYGTWKMDAQPYFEIAIEEALDEAVPIWEMAEEVAMAQEEMYLEMERVMLDTLVEINLAGAEMMYEMRDIHEEQAETLLEQIEYLQELASESQDGGSHLADYIVELQEQRREEIQAAREAIQDAQNFEKEAHHYQSYGAGEYLAELGGMVFAELLLSPLTMLVEDGLNGSLRKYGSGTDVEITDGR